MFYGQCWKCGERWGLGTASTCKCPDETPKRTRVGLTDEQARVKFEAWHKSTYTQPLERYGHTYKNMHVRNRWQGWLAAQGIERGV